MYRDGADRLRFDISGTMDGQPFEGSLFSSAEGSLFCAEGDQFAGLPGVDPNAEGVCLQTGAGGANPFANIEEFLGELDADDVDVVSTEEREIAGETGNCFTRRAGRRRVDRMRQRRRRAALCRWRHSRRDVHDDGHSREQRG